MGKRRAREGDGEGGKGEMGRGKEGRRGEGICQTSVKLLPTYLWRIAAASAVGCAVARLTVTLR